MAAGKLPFGAGAKVPTRTVSTQERLRRLEEAKAFLGQHLADGPQPAHQLIIDAKTAGIASRTLHRAKDALGVQVQRRGWGQGGQWVWIPLVWRNPPAAPTCPEIAEVNAGRVP